MKPKAHSTTPHMTESFLMCRPDYYAIDYIINPWMAEHFHQAQPTKALTQWEAFYKVLSAESNVHLLNPQPTLPDLIFTANAGLMKGKQVVVSRFHHPERQREEPFYHQWFEENAYEVLPWPANVQFEGEGDALFQPGQSLLWVGHGIRSDLAASISLEAFFSTPVVPLKLTNHHFYHLDTCFCPLLDGYVMYYPNAFDQPSLALIKENISEKYHIIINDEDAYQFACNAVVLKKRVIIMNHASQQLRQTLEKLGYRLIIQPVSEFLKAGGANKCLVLTL